MKKNVLHFLRKYSQLTESFLKNQIENHISFNPLVTYKLQFHSKTGGFADIQNLNIRQLNLSENEGGYSKFLFKFFKIISPGDKSRILNFIKENDIRILHFHYGSDAGIYLPILKITNLPSVVSFYGWDCTSFPKKYFGLGKRYLKNRVFKHVTKVFAMSGDMAKDLVSVGCPPDKIIVHYYGTDVQLFNYQRNYEQKDNLIRFIIISGFAEKKGHLFLLEAFSQALNINKNLRLTVVGDGDMRQKISEFIANNQLLDFVDLKSGVVYGSSEHLNYLEQHDVFIHPSVIDSSGDKEGIPGAVVEAMSSGLPVISTFHAGIPHVVSNEKTGILVKEWDIDGLKEAIIKIANSQDLRKTIGQNAREYALGFLDLHVKEIELENIYESLL